MQQQPERGGKLFGMRQYVEFRDEQDIGPEPMPDGQIQTDPDKPDRADELISALKEIISMAEKAIDTREKGLGDKYGNGKPTDEKPEDGSLNNLVSRPGPDSAQAPFGED
jgi:hypothetical protein